MQTVNIPIKVVSFQRKGKCENSWNPFRKNKKHNWISIHKHPKGGDVRVVFMLDKDECDGLEMCKNCSARRYNSKRAKIDKEKRIKEQKHIT